MTALKAHEVRRFLSRPDLNEGIFLVYGQDVGLVRETANTLVRYLAGNDPEAIVTLDGSALDADPGRLALEAGSSSLFSERRVIRVRGATKTLVMTLADIKDNLAGAAIVLEAGNLAPKDPLRSLVEAAKLGRALPCYPDTDEMLQMLITESFAKAGIAAGADVFATIRETLGNDREVTRREIEKLELFAAASKVLTRNDVLALCADNAALVLDEIVDAAGTGHAARLDEALNRALAAAVSPQQLLGGALSHFTQLRRWRTEIDNGRSVPDVLDGARPRPHFSRRSALEQQLRMWSDRALGAAAGRLHHAVADSRKRYELTDAVVRRALLAVCSMATG